jgi:hypothetical protein
MLEKVMTRDFAAASVMSSLDSIHSYMKNNIPRNNLSQQEYKKFVVIIGEQWLRR